MDFSSGTGNAFFSFFLNNINLVFFFIDRNCRLKKGIKDSWFLSDFGKIIEHMLGIGFELLPRLWLDDSHVFFKFHRNPNTF